MLETLLYGLCLTWAAKKALKTLDIGKRETIKQPNEGGDAPTLTNVFRSILKEANREDEVRLLIKLPSVWKNERKRRVARVQGSMITAILRRCVR